MMFPNEKILELKKEELLENSYINGTKTYYLDYENNRIAGFVNKIDAVKQWVYKVIHTEQNKYLIYGNRYGVEIEALIGGKYPHSFVEAEITRTIKEACMFNTEIESVGNFKFHWSFRALECSFVVYTVFGESFESKFLSSTNI